MGLFDKTILYYQKSLEIRQALLGSEHPFTIKTQQKISEIQAKLKEQEPQPNE